MKRSFFESIASFFAFCCVVFIPFPFNITKVQLGITDFIFGRLIGFVSRSVFGIPLADTKVYSDSVSMYILVLLLFILSVLLTFLLLRIKKWNLYRGKVFGFLYRLFFYYLALQLMKYGADKLFKNQFYLPEPNTLFTPMGRIDKDLLYWSSMGTSRFYSIFLGSLETLAAVFILSKPARLIGLVMSLGIMLNVVAVNFGFDISVKLYSLFLLYLTFYLLMPYRKRLTQLLVQQKPGILHPVLKREGFIKNSFMAVFLKWLVAGIICLEVLYPFIKGSKFNGDIATRPYLHGAYEVTQLIAGTDTLAAKNSPVKRFFIHRDSYMIFQNQEDEMQDYKLSFDPGTSTSMLTDYQLRTTMVSFAYRETDSILVVNYSRDSIAYQFTAKAIDWRKLPALQKGFHWTVDGGR